jgi:hypothetical protein
MIIILLLLGFLLYVLYHNKNVNLLSKEQTMDIITNNIPFYQTFSPSDLHARGVTSVDEYITLLKEKQIASDPTLYQKFILNICTLIADIRLYFIENKKNYDYIYGISSLKWNIGIINDNFYEGGMPHTIKMVNRENKKNKDEKEDNSNAVIILPSQAIDNYNFTILINTLIHEKVHVYQKTFPKKIDHYLKSKGYEIYASKEPNTLFRANPDIDNHIYQHLPTGQIYDMQYTSNTPSQVTDTIHKNYDKEHPFEEMAIHIEYI